MRGRGFVLVDLAQRVNGAHELVGACRMGAIDARHARARSVAGDKRNDVERARLEVVGARLVEQAAQTVALSGAAEGGGSGAARVRPLGDTARRTFSLLPTLRIFSPDPAAIRLRFA